MWKFSILFAIIAIVAYHNRDYFLEKKLLTPVISLSTGKIQGSIGRSRNGIEIYEYLAIPFAKPPISDLRFEPPQPPDSWTGVRDATILAPRCLQIDIITQQKYGQEDCLYLNVYVPQTSTPTKKLKRTMVWIHGGLFMYGSSDIFGANYFADEDIILVVISYRVASLGFLNYGEIKGNMGMKDQVQALKWVQQNIAMFGGDPKHVTIFGESAGGCSVHLHIISSMSTGLFSRAISQSGTAISPFLLSRNPTEQGIRLGKQLNCPTNNASDLIKCLKQIDAHTLINVHRETTDLLHERISIFSPSIETIIDSNTFLAEDPMVLLKSGKIANKVPWISGTNSDEGLILSAVIVQNDTLLKSLENNWNEVAPKFLFYEKNDSVSQHVRNQYFGKMKKIGKPSNLNKLTIMLSDRSFYWPVSESAILQAKISPVYLYYYSHVGDFSLAHLCTLFRGRFHYTVELIFDLIASFVDRNILGRRHHNYGCCHADEQFIQFNTPFSSITPHDKEQYKMSRDFVKLFADFAKDEKNLNFRGVKWLPINPEKKLLRYLMIDMSYGVIDEPFTNRIKYWKENYVI